jgi:O-antigen/teichoic acid export membrane protein
LSVSTGGINNGITKYVAEHSSSQKKINLYLKSSVWIVGAFTLLSSLTLIFGSKYFATIVLNDSKYQSIIIIFGLTLWLYAINNILLSILNGYKQFELFVKINVVSSIVSLLFTCILSYFYGVYGALLSSVTYQSVVVIITFYLCIKSKWFVSTNFFGRFSFLASKRLAHYSVMTLVSAATAPVGQLLIRSRITEKASLIDAGIWEGITKISGMYLMVITTSLSIYYLPRFSEIIDKNDLRKEIMSAFKLIIPLLLVISILLLLTNKWIILILFNKDFNSMTDLFPFQLLGDFFKIASWILSFQMVAKSMTKMYITTEIFTNTIFVLFSFYFIDKLGVYGATVGYALTYIIYFILMLFLFRKLMFKQSL